VSSTYAHKGGVRIPVEALTQTQAHQLVSESTPRHRIGLLKERMDGCGGGGRTQGASSITVWPMWRMESCQNGGDDA